MRSGGSFAVVQDELVVSGGDTSRNSTIFLGQAGRRDVIFYELGNYLFDENTNPITDSLPSDGAESHYQTSTRKYQLLMGSHC